MDYEKKYKEALERCREFYAKFSNKQIKEEIEVIFPELKESEDERIRKELISFFKDRKSRLDRMEDMFDPSNFPCDDYSLCEKALAWLEKQGEHKKFRDSIQVGDKVTRNEDGALVNLSQLNRVAKKDEKKGEQEFKFRIGDTIKKKSTGDIVTISEVDTKNKEYMLTNTGFIPFEYESLWQLIEHKPAEWSEEDEKMIQDIINDIAIAREQVYCKSRCEDEINWLKSLKDRHTWKPSDEQIRPLEYAIDYFKKKKNDTTYLESLYQDLLKLK